MRALALFILVAVASPAFAQTDTRATPVPAGTNPGPVVDGKRMPDDGVGRAGLADPARTDAATRPNGDVAPPSAISSGVQVIAPEKK